MDNIIIATKNSGKAKEYKLMLESKGINIRTLADMPTTIINENGTSFEENALIKAQTIINKFNVPVLADDSGLSVDILNGEPGIHSARYAGDHDDIANREKLLRKLSGVPNKKRTAHFHTSIVALKPNGKKLVANGSINGHILTKPIGDNGFGYDPIFYIDELQCSMAELTPTQKNKISHRGNALRNLMHNFDEWWKS